MNKDDWWRMWKEAILAQVTVLLPHHFPKGTAEDNEVRTRDLPYEVEVLTAMHRGNGVRNVSLFRQQQFVTLL